MESKITEIFYLVDEFCKEFNKTRDAFSISTVKKKRNRKFIMTESEVITILILFHTGGYRNLKHFYTNYVQLHLKSEFPKTVSYNRFVELQSKVVLPMGVFLKTMCLGKCTGISFIDSTPLRACHHKREKQHKVFKNLAKKGQCSLGWFYGFKLHIVINDKGEILDFLFTPGNIDDRAPLKNKNFHQKVFGKIYGDKGYIGKELFEQLFIDGIHLVTKHRKNMKNSLMLMQDRIMLRKRALVESVNDELKNICQIEHTRHRSFDNFLSNLLSGLIAYHFLDKKPLLNLEIIENKEITTAA